MRQIRGFIVHPFLSFLIIAIVGLLLAPNISAQPLDNSLYSGLRWRMIGPFRGGRVNAVSGVAGQPDTFYFGSVGGGVWKSLNSGRTWNPVFDSIDVASIGAIGVAPSIARVVPPVMKPRKLPSGSFMTLTGASGSWSDGPRTTIGCSNRISMHWRHGGVPSPAVALLTIVSTAAKLIQATL